VRPGWNKFGVCLVMNRDESSAVISSSMTFMMIGK
jgi:hypothetical protein